MPLPTIHRTRDKYLLSSDRDLLSLPAINDALSSPQLYWGRKLSDADFQTMFSASYCLGLYHTPQPPEPDQTADRNNAPASTPTQVGFGRLITDHVTFAYLSDVYVLPEHQGKGLGKWLMQCIAEVLDGMPELRRALLITGKGKHEEFYGEVLGAKRMSEEGRAVTLHVLGPQSLEKRGLMV